MKTETFVNRISDLKNKKGQVKRTYINALISIKNLCKKGSTIHPVRWTKVFGRFRLEDKLYNDIVYLLQNSGVEFTEGNDAQRGGAEGKFIELTSKGRQQLKNVDFNSLITF